MPSLDRSEFLAGYLAEADEHLRASAANLLAVEAAIAANAPHHRRVRDLFRSLHTLKGLSAMVGIEPIVELAHEMESILRTADRTGALTTPSVDVLLRGLRAIEERVAAVAGDAPVLAAPPALLESLRLLDVVPASLPEGAAGGLDLEPELLAKLATSERDQLATEIARGRRAWRIDFAPHPSRAAAGVTITSVRERVSALGEIVKVVPRPAARDQENPGGLVFILLVVSDAPAEEVARAADLATNALIAVGMSAAPTPARDDVEELEPAAPIAEAPRDVIRVDVRRLDDSLEKLSALVVTRFRLGRAVAALRERGVDVRDLVAIVDDNARQLAALRDSITSARMVPLKDILERIPLLVRGMSRSTGKPVRVHLDAGDAELDKGVADRIFPAVVHLVRNAVDHAIEPVDVRRRLGKPDEGTIHVRCFQHSDSRLELTITDDGAGIDAAAVAARAGQPMPADAARLLDLVCTPGLSTRTEATSNSGRGMGMDIVKRVVVDGLGGELLLDTQPGVGTTFTLRVPLSISILDSFSFLAGAQPFVVPVATIEEIVEVDRAQLVTPPSLLPGMISDGRDARLLRRRGEVVPLFQLASLFDLAAALDGGRKALVVRRRGEPFAFAVDRMLGQQQVVVRPVEDPLVRRPGIAGTTDLGDGKPTLVLDLVGLVGTVARTAVGVA